jgi:hypothetical protein
MQMIDFPRVVTVVAERPVQKRPGLSIQKIKSSGEVGVVMPATNHPLVETPDLKKLIPRHKLKIARIVIDDIRTIDQDHVVKGIVLAPFSKTFDDDVRSLSRQEFPKRFGTPNRGSS